MIYYLKLNISQNLMQVLKARELGVKSEYFGLLRKTGSPWEKRQIIQAYYTEKNALDSIAAELTAYGNLLQTIADGHQKLMEEAGHLNTTELKNAIGQYASNIKDLHTQIQLIRK